MYPCVVWIKRVGLRRIIEVLLIDLRKRILLLLLLLMMKMMMLLLSELLLK